MKSRDRGTVGIRKGFRVIKKVKINFGDDDKVSTFAVPNKTGNTIGSKRKAESGITNRKSTPRKRGKHKAKLRQGGAKVL